MLTLLLVLFGCGVVRYGGPAVVPAPVEPSESTTNAGGTGLPVLIRAVDNLLESTDEVDQRDRLIELRDLLASAGQAEPAIRRRIAAYAERVLYVEARGRPEEFAESPMEIEAAVVITSEEPLGIEVETPIIATPAPLPPEVPLPLPPEVPLPLPPEVPAGLPLGVNLPAGDPLPALRVRLAKREYLAVVEAIDAQGAPSADAASLRREAVNAWAAAEREAAGAAFLAARAQTGQTRRAQMQAVIDQLAAINKRFPDNSYAADVQKHLDLVTSELNK